MKKIFGLVFLTILSGCGKDKNVQDYRSELFAKDFAQFQAVADRYSGQLKTQDGRIMGGIQITLTASSQLQAQTDGSKASPVPILLATIELQTSDTRMSLIAPNSVYVPGNGHFETEIQIAPDTSGQSNGGGASAGSNPGAPVTPGQPSSTTGDSYTITVQGVLSGSTITGTISERHYPDLGGNFTVSRGGANLSDLGKQTDPNLNLFLSTRSYVGSTKFLIDRTSRPVNLVILKPQTTSAQDVLNLFSPVKTVLMTWDYGEAVHLQVSGATWDQYTKKLVGNLNITSHNQPVTIESKCSQTDASTLDCVHNTSASGLVATSKLVLSKKAGRPQEPVSSPRKPMIQTYLGQTSASRVIQLTVNYPALDRLTELLDFFVPEAERTVQVSYILTTDAGAVPNSFSTVLWDVHAGTLNGVQPTTYGPQTLNCYHFTFTASKNYNFNCSLSGGTLKQPLDLVFLSKN